MTGIADSVGASDLQLYLYHFPQNSGVPFTIDTVARLRDHFPDTLVGLKDSSGDLAYSAALAARLPGFDVFPSAEGSIAKAAELGFAGCISATANITGALASAAFRDPTATASLERAVRIRAIIAAYPLVAAVKAALAMMSGDQTWHRLVPPLTSLSEPQLAELHPALAAAGVPVA